MFVSNVYVIHLINKFSNTESALMPFLVTFSPVISEGWEQNGLYEFFRAKMRARRKKGQEKRSR